MTHNNDIQRLVKLVNQAGALVQRMMNKQNGERRYYLIIHHAARRAERRQAALQTLRGW